MRTTLRVLALVDIALILASATLAVAARSASNFVSACFFLVFPVVALIILRSGRATSVAACFAVAALLDAIEKNSDALTTLGLRYHWPSGAVRWAAWGANWTWFPGLFLLITIALLRFPEGRFLSPAWRWVERITIVAMVVWVAGISAAAATVPVSVLISAVEPLPPPGFARVVFEVGEPMFAVLALCAVASFASLVVRYRRGGPVERAQTRWVLTAAGVAVVIELALSLHGFFVGHTPFWLVNVGEGVGFGLIAIATGIAISRYQLYEIDRVVSRGVAYAVVLVTLGGIYVGVLAGVAALVPRDYGQLGVAAATLAVTVLAVPLTRRVRGIVDRRFNRARFDGQRVVIRFAARLRARPVDSDVRDDLLAVLDRTVQPAHAGVWIRHGAPDRPRAPGLYSR